MKINIHDFGNCTFPLIQLELPLPTLYVCVYLHIYIYIITGLIGVFYEISICFLVKISWIYRPIVFSMDFQLHFLKRK